MGEIFGQSDAAAWIAVPSDDDDKYSRGVVGFVTGSARYPGAAVLGVEAALRIGVGMVRYLGPGRATRLVLQRRPETVTTDGRVQAWVVGSGQDPRERDELTRLQLETALRQGVPVVLDAGALDLWPEATGSSVLTPHAGELARLLDVGKEEVMADREAAARQAAATTGATVLLKGAETLVASPGGELLRVRNATPWLATAGAGDALAGILGALVAPHADARDLAPIAAAAAWIHGEAAQRASNGGPFTVLDLCAALPTVVRDLVTMSA
ncbi:NAD(P)H-hydrate dehydratase [Pseudolysinimonas sp.]|uniref:NAD(P)H-hydrate dehydratase n=1 Tax=Pseudolysinimonas sp. TaxID=2680009 RepID=UPI00286B0CA6|nr:NAD(P)H-hydrate dehydratase [Pseudolysinimonas sp.]